MDYHVGVKNVRENVLDTKTKAQKSIYDLKTVIGPSRGSKRSFAVNAANGRTRVSFTRTDQAKMASIARARSVHLKLPANLTSLRN